VLHKEKRSETKDPSDLTSNAASGPPGVFSVESLD